ncbi:hypothetical protein P9E76_15575 [Schinkia azotoformans]|uniref:Uncharacterized protein n=1 Tax=Schinkia azotoformans LMG 9581 TaxID=1131731 RepID=K6E4D9_SCHAZ|nr:hypothetical protein [Schinkia azotoformans]EKN68091.1 hypothetical protein BAZO_06224 [Schinkia azotoformans LMG 9581]MEC1638102.1 hypothetical protein [Schinkia azotoformans]MEC1946464.1 hypothetical protein [Schinkia azotoformans]
MEKKITEKTITTSLGAEIKIRLLNEPSEEALKNFAKAVIEYMTELNYKKSVELEKKKGVKYADD